MNQVTITGREATNSLPMLNRLEAQFKYRASLAQANRTMKPTSLARLIEEVERTMTSLRMNLHAITKGGSPAFEQAANEDLERISSLVQYFNNRKDAQ